MKEGSNEQSLPGVRGDPDHAVRHRILAATQARFRHYGYDKTTVADIASDVGISPAYVYKFYASKLAICEAIVGEMVARIAHDLADVANQDAPASERLRLLYKVMLEQSVALFFEERKLHDLIRVGLDARYQSVEALKQAMRDAARTIIMAGRASGEFEKRVPLADVVDAIWISLVPFAHPAVLEHLQDNIDLARHARNMADLALRGLTPG
jgi:AcrR family transcriptional regulator